MSKAIKVGIVGCGAIGESLATVLFNDLKKDAALAAVFDIDTAKAVSLSKNVCNNPKVVAATIKELISRSDLVIEAAHARHSWQIASNVVNNGRDVMIMSVGGILEHFDELTKLAQKRHARIYIPSGAIAGIDALRAASLSEVKSVVLTTFKNPNAFKGVKYVEERKFDLDYITEDKVLFSGSAKEAVKCFPQNINVAAILSIAGIGLEKTKVKIVASPAAQRNIHQVEIESDSGKILTRTENLLHPDNPKTSYLAVLSAVATLRRIFDDVKIGT